MTIVMTMKPITTASGSARNWLNARFNPPPSRVGNAAKSVIALFHAGDANNISQGNFRRFGSL